MGPPPSTSTGYSNNPTNSSPSRSASSSAVSMFVPRLPHTGPPPTNSRPRYSQIVPYPDLSLNLGDDLPVPVPSSMLVPSQAQLYPSYAVGSDSLGMPPQGIWPRPPPGTLAEPSFYDPGYPAPALPRYSGTTRAATPVQRISGRREDIQSQDQWTSNE
uniref:Uncharacterized protein n=1 Tax=Mycena chlorophos TaxID=658473 RepID=A0ABQ0LK25_MYCCL|nr:predicted protein [Mycena chlorophos]